MHDVQSVVVPVCAANSETTYLAVPNSLVTTSTRHNSGITTRFIGSFPQGRAALAAGKAADIIGLRGDNYRQ